MESLKLPKERLCTALLRLEESIEDLENFKKRKSAHTTDYTDYERQERTFRDSLIKRFEFCVDLFWKYLKKYLEIAGGNPPEIYSPKPVIKAACKAKLITEQDTEVLLEMIDSRNQTSHIYKEEIADQIGAKAPIFYKIMHQYAQKL
jgi:nucleotidyltransferase substrate binding protein (TIGR01987 family)